MGAHYSVCCFNGDHIIRNNDLALNITVKENQAGHIDRPLEQRPGNIMTGQTKVVMSYNSLPVLRLGLTGGGSFDDDATPSNSSLPRGQPLPNPDGRNGTTKVAPSMCGGGSSFCAQNVCGVAANISILETASCPPAAQESRQLWHGSRSRWYLFPDLRLGSRDSTAESGDGRRTSDAGYGRGDHRSDQDHACNGFPVTKQGKAYVLAAAGPRTPVAVGATTAIRMPPNPADSKKDNWDFQSPSLLQDFTANQSYGSPSPRGPDWQQVSARPLTSPPGTTANITSKGPNHPLCNISVVSDALVEGTPIASLIPDKEDYPVSPVGQEPRTQARPVVAGDGGAQPKMMRHAVPHTRRHPRATDCRNCQASTSEFPEVATSPKGPPGTARRRCHGPGLAPSSGNRRGIPPMLSNHDPVHAKSPPSNAAIASRQRTQSNSPEPQSPDLPAHHIRQLMQKCVTTGPSAQGDWIPARAEEDPRNFVQRTEGQAGNLPKPEGLDRRRASTYVQSPRQFSGTLSARMEQTAAMLELALSRRSENKAEQQCRTSVKAMYTIEDAEEDEEGDKALPPARSTHGSDDGDAGYLTGSTSPTIAPRAGTLPPLHPNRSSGGHHRGRRIRDKLRRGSRGSSVDGSDSEIRTEGLPASVSLRYSNEASPTKQRHRLAVNSGDHEVRRQIFKKQVTGFMMDPDGSDDVKTSNALDFQKGIEEMSRTTSFLQRRNV